MVSASSAKVVMDLGQDADAWQAMRLHVIEDGDHYTTHRFKPSGPGL